MPVSAVPEWVKRQRKIAKKRSFEDGYFTLAMLEQDCHISKGIKGIDPDGTDQERAAGEAAWFKAHPVMTAENREKKRVMGLKNKGFISGKGGENGLSLAGLVVPPDEKGTWIPLLEKGLENA